MFSSFVKKINYKIVLPLINVFYLIYLTFTELNVVTACLYATLYPWGFQGWKKQTYITKVPKQVIHTEVKDTWKSEFTKMFEESGNHIFELKIGYFSWFSKMSVITI